MFLFAAGLALVAVTSCRLRPVRWRCPPTSSSTCWSVAKFTPAEVASLEAGKVIAKVAPGGVEQEVVAVAAVKIRTPRKQVVAYYGQMVAYVDGEVTKGFGTFQQSAGAGRRERACRSTPPILRS